MKALLSLFLIVSFLLGTIVSRAEHPQSTTEEQQSYCYKPGKPLMFASSDYKARYEQDMLEYKNCHQGFLEMQARVTHMRHESEKHTQLLREQFLNKHY